MNYIAIFVYGIEKKKKRKKANLPLNYLDMLYIVKQLIIILKYVVAILVDVVLIAKYVVKL
jgi:hypothetical protein